MIKRIVLLVVIISSSLNLFSSGSMTILNENFSVDTLFHAQIGPSTTQTTLLLHGESYDLRVFYMTADMTNPNILLEAVCATDNVAGCETTAESAVRRSREGHRLFAGTNSNGFMTSGTASNGVSKVGTPMSTAISNGEILLISNYDDQFIVDTNGLLKVGRLSLNSSYLEHGTDKTVMRGVNVGGWNDNGVTIYTSKYYGVTSQEGMSGICAEVTAELVENEEFVSGKECLMRITSAPTSDGKTIIPENGFAIHGRGTDIIQGNISAIDFVNSLEVGDIVKVNPMVTLNNEVIYPEQVTSGKPTILKSGVVLDTEGEMAGCSSYNPRTGIGYGDNGDKVIMMVVDGRSVISNGARTSQLADIMKYAGATDAINLDGGGSSTLYTEALGVRNIPSDGKVRAVGNSVFFVNESPDDEQIASIGFEDWAKSFPKYGVYEPVIYGYNKYGTLVDTDVQGFELSCPAELGRVNGETFIGDGEGTYALTANYNGMTASIPVTVSEAEELSLRLDSVVNDTYREYAVEVSAMHNGKQSSLDPAALTWSAENETIVDVDIDKGVLKGLKNGETVVTGTVGDFSDAIKVIVEKPESNVMAIDPDMDVSTWMIAQVGGKDREVTPYENGMKIKYTGVSGRSPYLRLSKANRLWSLPDAIRISFNPGDAPIKSVTLTTMDAHDVGYTNAMENEIVANEMNVIELRTADWCNADDLSNYPMSLNQIQFGMGASTTNAEYEILISGIECIYDSAPASVADALADGAQVATIYPNPINKGESAVITGVADGICIVNIYTLAGELVSSSSVDCVAGSATIPTAQLLQGVYFIKTTAEDGSQYVNKLIVR